MSEMQKMLDGSIVPVAPHRDDVVECSDGTVCPRHEAMFDCRGAAHRDEDALNDANDDIVRELLDAENEWIGDYVSSDDYGDRYAYLVMESCHGWHDRIGEWLDANHNDGAGWNARPVYTGDVRKAIIDEIHARIDSYDFEAHYQSNEYACWAGDGCCLDSFEVGEYEDQIEVSRFPEFVALEESGDLEGCLDRYNGDLYVRCNDRWDAAAGRRVRTGYVEDGMFYGYSGGWGRWHYVVSDDRMNELLCEAICALARRADRSGAR